MSDNFGTPEFLQANIIEPNSINPLNNLGQIPPGVIPPAGMQPMIEISLSNDDVEELLAQDEKIIKIKYLPGAHPIENTEIGDWIDMYVYEDTLCKKGEYTLINLGCAMELPKGYEGHLVPRSSTYKRWGIIQANHCGIFDNSYCGDNDIWCMPAIALNEDVTIPKDTRVCQFRIVHNQPKIKFQEVQSLDNKDRGGFGSTGE